MATREQDNKNRIDQLEGAVQGMLERIEALYLIKNNHDLSIKHLLKPDPRATPDEFMKEMLQTQAKKVLTRLGKLEEQNAHHEVTRNMVLDLNRRMGVLTTEFTDFRDAVASGQARQEDRMAGIEGRLTALVKAVEGFAQIQVDLQAKVNVIQSWLNVQDSDLGIDVPESYWDTFGKKEDPRPDLTEESLEKAAEDMLKHGKGLLRTQHVPLEEVEKTQELRSRVDEVADDGVRGEEPLNTPPEVYIRDNTHGQHPRKVVVYLD